MSQYSPTVHNTSGEAFARALGQGVDSYLNARRQRQLDERQEKQDASVAAEHQRVIAREGQQDQLAQALGASQLRDRGFVPDAERGPNERLLASGDDLNGVVSAATGPQFAAALGQPDARAPRYGASTGGYSYDYAGPQAQAQGAKLAEQLAQTEKLRRPAAPTAPLMGSPEWQKAQRFSAALDQGSHQANRAYGVAHPLKDPQAARPTDGQRQVGGLLPEIEDAGVKLDLITPDFVSQHLGHVPIIGNYARTDQGRQFNQTAKQFITNTVYAKSGKGVTVAEMDSLMDALIPQPGDDEGTIKQKANARRLFVQGARTMAGSAAPPLAALPSATSGDTGRTVTVNGKTFTVPE